MKSWETFIFIPSNWYKRSSIGKMSSDQVKNTKDKKRPLVQSKEYRDRNRTY